MALILSRLVPAHNSGGGIIHAGETDPQTRTSGCPTRQSPYYSGRGIRSGRGSPRPQKQAWGTQPKAGNCHRPVQGAKGRSKGPTATERNGFGAKRALASRNQKEQALRKTLAGKKQST